MTTFEVPDESLHIMGNNNFFEGECYKAHPPLVSLFSLTEPWRRQDRNLYIHLERFREVES